MNRVFITRRETFNAAHKLWQPAWSDQKNQEVFGACSNKNWHGHNFTLFVTVSGEPNSETGFVMNLQRLSTLIRSEVTAHLDHKNLNLDVPFLRDVMASTENVAIAIWNILAPQIRELGAELEKIKLVETENNFVEYYGGNKPF
ncbi:MAG: 6-carboxytetrahydropterin synthase [Bacteroidetes bacterium]|nr:6-carboxytetrahydropterin synthase [Bacteroidota bacterium]MBM3424627.1 6-carboxytetrahydropterin synthase [Bacteroidota bacterium]